MKTPKWILEFFSYKVEK